MVSDGTWNCPWHLDGGQCANGDFTCDCPAGGKATFTIGCCYHFPGFVTSFEVMVMKSLAQKIYHAIEK